MDARLSHEAAGGAATLREAASKITTTISFFIASLTGLSYRRSLPMVFRVGRTLWPLLFNCRRLYALYRLRVSRNSHAQFSIADWSLPSHEETNVVGCRCGHCPREFLDGAKL